MGFEIWTKLFRGVLLMLLSTVTAQASQLETLIMPGEVIAGHAKYETECSRCHARFSKTNQNTLCLDCHEDIRSDLSGKTGFHGRKPGLTEMDCKGCHTEHKGRDADIVKLNRDSFDHKLTDYELKGAHIGVNCTSCHVENKPYRNAQTECVACHKEDDPHKKRLGEACSDCHSEKSWSNTRFDHDKTDFKLKGKHRDVICGSCHPNQRYENTPIECSACHALNDVHGGRNGTQCADCHSEQRWDHTSFDHDRNTDFPLRGRHGKLSCVSCHTGPMKEQTLKTDCVSCHRADDSHHGRNGTACESCHAADSWSNVRFDHAKKTDFPLLGHHQDLVCGSCHRGSLKDDLQTACISCHRADDVHRGKQGDDCARCHRESGWGERVVFDHDLTRFPLIGLHATAPCEECHISATFQEAPKTCAECHKSDDVHKRSLGKNCGHCHNPNGWALWEFDHDRSTDFPLEGAHRGLECAGCHRYPVKADDFGLSRVCSVCHAADDKHRGRFGKQCDRCHDQESFEHLEMNP